MKERPILFSGPMVNGIIAGRKLQTRRLRWSKNKDGKPRENRLCKLQPGDQLWVRERAMCVGVSVHNDYIMLKYDADGCEPEYAIKFPDRLKYTPMVGKRLSMGTYREASRINLEVERVWTEQLNDISEQDACEEGVTFDPNVPEQGFYVPGVDHPIKDFGLLTRSTARGMYAALWDTIHGSGEWLENPEVVAIKFNVLGVSNVPA